MTHDWRGIAAKPTFYRGRLMRSRLEAKWAAFFDRCGWAWEYEPENLPGWSPDFVLLGQDRWVWVEVKPKAGLWEATSKIERAARAVGTARESSAFLFVSECPVEKEGLCWVGMAYAHNPDYAQYTWGATDLVTCRRGHPLEFDLHWRDPGEDTCLLALGNETSGNVVSVSSLAGTHMWNSAANEVRYNPGSR